MMLCPAAAVHVLNGPQNYCMRLFLASFFGHSVLGCVDCSSQMFCQGVIRSQLFSPEKEREKKKMGWGEWGGAICTLCTLLSLKGFVFLSRNSDHFPCVLLS